MIENGRTTKIECDALAVSGGWNPAVHLTCHLGGKPVWTEEIAAFTPGTMPPGMHVAGAANGALTLGQCLTGGMAAGAMAAVECGYQMASIALPRADDEPAAIAPLWHVKESRAKAFVDFQNDVTVERHRARRSRGLQRGRAPEALHHARHGDRPGQDRERHRACDPRRALRPQHSAGRHHDLPPALRAGELRRDGRPSSRPRLPSDPPARPRINGRPSRARCSSKPARGCARSIIRAPARRTGSKPSTAR